MLHNGYQHYIFTFNENRKIEFTVATECAYDKNGNLTKDLNKNITNISYNCLNLPQTVTFGDGSMITYLYAADGTKLRTTHTIGGVTTTTDYCGNVLYENGTQKQLLTEEGYIDLSASTPTYYYYLKDHQGNNRVVVNSSGVVQETNHYYPFGGLFATNSSVQKFKYNGKEFDSKGGLNWYDYGARHYDATLGRWHVVDPMAEEMYAWSPYDYCFNNPMKFADEDGMLPGPGDLFPTKREAAVDWGMYYNGYSITNKREMGSTIYAVTEDKGTLKGYSYSAAHLGNEHDTKLSSPPEGKEIVATIHSHGNYSGVYRNEKGELLRAEDNKFSPKDISMNEKLGVIGYLATPSGTLLEYNPHENVTTVISYDLPSDRRDPNRKSPSEKNLFESFINWISSFF